MPATKTPSAPQIDAQHPHYTSHLPLWTMIADCIEGEQKIKAGRTTYLPAPNASDTSPANLARYNAYLLRAVFYAATARTQSNLVGQCFALPPVYTGPDELKILLDDIDGTGATAEQQSKEALGNSVAFSRSGLFVDYPKTEGVVTVADAEAKGVRAKVILYPPENIINWREEMRGAKSMLAKVVLTEEYIAEDDGYETTVATQYRVLLLREGVYVVEVWRQSENGFTLFETATPTHGSGETFDFIPFKFIGAESNNTAVEKPKLLDLANLNLGHYRNSADYEESVYMVGQPTPWAAGLTDDWVSTHLRGKIELGSRGLIPLPEGGTAGLLQVEPGSLPKEAMDQKEALMVAIGARLVENREVARTATEAGIDEGASTSDLASCVSNVSEAYTEALRWAALFQNITVTEVEASDSEDAFGFVLNRDFAVAKMSAEERNANREDYNADLITFDEARDNLKGGGVAWLDNETAKEEMEAKAEADFKQAQAAFGAAKVGTTEKPNPNAPE